MTKEKQAIKNWEKATNEILEVFVEKYFGIRTSTFYWACDKVGYIAYVNDYWFDVEDMLEFLRNDYSFKDLDNYYWHRLEASEKGNTYANIEDWKKLKNTKIKNENRKTKTN